MNALRNVFLLFLLLVTAGPIIYCSKGAGDTDISAVLEKSYVDEKQERTFNEDSKVEKIKKAEIFRMSGSKYLQEKKYKEAKRCFVDSLENNIHPETYYFLGNLLVNEKNYKEGIKAYKLSIDLKYEKVHLAYYNTACAFSLLKEEQDSFLYLKNAILHGYKYLQYISKDNDLAYLRSLDDWPKKYSEISELYKRGMVKVVSGKRLTHSYASSEDVYFFCADGSVKVQYMISEHRNHMNLGRWKMENYIITVDLNREKGEKGVGRPVACASTCTYSSYKPFEKKIRRQEVFNWHLLQKNKYGHWKLEDLTSDCHSFQNKL